MEQKGKIKIIEDAKQVSEKFKVREFVLETDGKYPQPIQFRLAQERCELINGYGTGDEVTVHFNLRGREWTNKDGNLKYFNELECWKIEGKKGYNNPDATQSEKDEAF